MEYETFEGMYDTENTLFIIEEVPSLEMEFIDFEKEDDEGNTIITFGLSRFDDNIKSILTDVSEYFFQKFRTSLNLYVATLEFVKLFSLQKGKFCTYDSFKNSFLFQIFLHAISSNPEYLSYCRGNNIFQLDTCKRMDYLRLMNLYEENFLKCETNLTALRLDEQNI